MLDLEALAKAADELMVPSKKWQETFTAPVVRELIRLAEYAAEYPICSDCGKQVFNRNDICDCSGPT
jgi:hypothetical protein